MRSFLFAACGTGFTFLLAALGAALVFVFDDQMGERPQRLAMGFAGGVMCAASVFSLLLPAMEQAQALGAAPWLLAASGFLLGAGWIGGVDALLRRRMALSDTQRRQALLFSAMTLHNIPEGMAVGLAFSLTAQSGTSMAGAAALALGVGIQNLPESAALALPLRQSGMSRRRSFLLSVLSSVVEPVFGVMVVLVASAAGSIMPMLMALSAGAMMLVVITEMIPASGAYWDGAAAAVIGYAMMMALDTALG